MKLVYPEYKYQIIFDEDIINVVIIENQKEFTHLLEELLQQCGGKEGRFVLSEDDKILKISTDIQCIVNPMIMELNTKKIIDKIYEQLKETVQTTEMYLEVKKLYGMMMEFIQRTIDQYDYHLVYDDLVEEKSLFKMVDLRVAEEGNDLLSKIVDYMKLNSRLLKCKVFLFVNLKSFLTEEELKLLYKTCLYEKYNLVLIESMNRPEKNANERVLIIDKDCCEIY